MKNQVYNNQKSVKIGGFTLIEVIVSVAIFAVVMTMAAGAIISALDANDRNLAIELNTDNLQNSINQISREIQRGDAYHCREGGAIDEGQGCYPTGNTYFAFEGENGDPFNPDDQIVYKLENDRIYRSVDSGLNFTAITAPNVVINDLRFFTPDASGNETPNRVQISLSATTASGPDSESEYSLQTTVSNIDIQAENSGAGIYAQNPYCPIEETFDQILFDFSNEKTDSTLLWGPGDFPDQNYAAWRGPFRLPAPVESGRSFDLRIVVWDNHCDAGGNCTVSSQENEQMYIELWNADQDTVYTSNKTADIPDDQNISPEPWLVNADATISEEAPYITFYCNEFGGSATSSCGSMVPACISIEYDNTGQEINVEEF